MKLLLLLIVFVLVQIVVYAAKNEDLVTKLPGFNGATPSKHYSGYLPVGQLSGTKGQLHYWFIESTKSPKDDPVVLWLNGGILI
jgi:serine carboxypeptidase-like clade 1